MSETSFCYVCIQRGRFHDMSHLEKKMLMSKLILRNLDYVSNIEIETVQMLGMCNVIKFATLAHERKV